VDLGIFPVQPSFSLLAAPSDLLSSDPRHDRSPAPLLPLILGTLFSAFLLSLPAFLFLGHCGMWENAETLWQSLLFALFFSPSEEGQMQHFPALPPIQFRERRNLPGVLFAPRPPRRRIT
jgi:hypothetical protein